MFLNGKLDYGPTTLSRYGANKLKASKVFFQAADYKCLNVQNMQGSIVVTNQDALGRKNTFLLAILMDLLLSFSGGLKKIHCLGKENQTN